MLSSLTWYYSKQFFFFFFYQNSKKYYILHLDQDLPGNSAGKKSVCSAGDPGSILGSGRSPGEGVGYTLQHSWASLVAQMVKNWPGHLGLIPGLGRPPGGGHGDSIQYFCLENPYGQRRPAGYSPWDPKELDMTE